MAKPIVLKSRTKQEETVGVVRLSPEAERVARRLSCLSGMPLRRVVSEIIVQAEHLVEVYTPDAMGEEE